MTWSTPTDRHGTGVATESSYPNLQAGSREHTGIEMSLSKPQSLPPITLIFQQGHTSQTVPPIGNQVCKHTNLWWPFSLTSTCFFFFTILYEWLFSLHVCVCTHYECLVPTEARRWYQIPCNWRYRQLWPIMGVLVIKRKSFAEAASVPNCWAIFPVREP